jgi:hypothetical protein
MMVMGFKFDAGTKKIIVAFEDKEINQGWILGGYYKDYSYSKESGIYVFEMENGGSVGFTDDYLIREGSDNYKRDIILCRKMWDLCIKCGFEEAELTTLK